jgi:hypothetical protein
MTELKEAYIGIEVGYVLIWSKAACRWCCRASAQDEPALPNLIRKASRSTLLTLGLAQTQLADRNSRDHSDT